MERLNKVLAHAGVGSRRQCDELIRAGRVTIDGAVVRDLGTRVDPDSATVAVDGTPIRSERAVYWLLHKPRGVLSTSSPTSNSASTPSADWTKPAKASCC
jgi:23S rRNA pseudouridine2605 synthase